jgi:hypothetical protein
MIHSRTAKQPLLPAPNSLHFHASLLCVCILLVPLSTGCNESSNAVQVRGTVTYQSEPVPNGLITFYPVTGRPVSGPLSEEGQYRVSLEPGDYTATVRVGIEKPPSDYKEGDPLPPPKVELPREYTSRARSTLEATVAPDQSEPIDFALD